MACASLAPVLHLKPKHIFPLYDLIHWSLYDPGVINRSFSVFLPVVHTYPAEVIIAGAGCKYKPSEGLLDQEMGHHQTSPGKENKSQAEITKMCQRRQQDAGALQHFNDTSVQTVVTADPNWVEMSVVLIFLHLGLDRKTEGQD